VQISFWKPSRALFSSTSMLSRKKEQPLSAVHGKGAVWMQSHSLSNICQLLTDTQTVYSVVCIYSVV
jgi:uncharacterized protein (AIM24 family)